MTALVLGSTGQVGRHLQALLPGATFWGRAQLDLTAPERIEAAVLRVTPSLIVNAAAYTAVDRAESEPDIAWRVNVEAPTALARAARALDVPLLHISTDYVFDGTAHHGYRATDAVAPINVYGRTKLAGELAVASLCARYWILRTSWVFSEHGNNFVKTMLRLALERETLRVVDDQHGTPTYAEDLARIIRTLVLESVPAHAFQSGIYHVGGGAPTTWRLFAEEIVLRASALGLIGRVPKVVAISTAEYPTPARRPMNSILESSPALLQAARFEPDWRLGLDTMLARLHVSARE